MLPNYLGTKLKGMECHALKKKPGILVFDLSLKEKKYTIWSIVIVLEANFVCLSCPKKKLIVCKFHKAVIKANGVFKKQKRF